MELLFPPKQEVSVSMVRARVYMRVHTRGQIYIPQQLDSRSQSCGQRFQPDSGPGLSEMKRRLLLVSNSTLHGGGYLDHCEQNISDFFGK